MQSFRHSRFRPSIVVGNWLTDTPEPAALSSQQTAALAHGCTGKEDLSAAPEQPSAAADSDSELCFDNAFTEPNTDIGEAPEHQPDYTWFLPHNNTQESLKTDRLDWEPTQEEPSNTASNQHAPEIQESQHNFQTVSTLLIASGERCGPKNRPNPPNQDWRPNQEGRLVKDYPHAKMEDVATQLATLPAHDPNGRKHSLDHISDQDRLDVLCILSPGSLAAIQAVKLIAATTPQHILQKEWCTENPIPLPTDAFPSDESPADGDEENAQPDSMTVDKDAHSDKPLDIALRMSSRLLNPHLGFSFGRTPEKSDLLLSINNSYPRISGAHFRIYVNPQGTLMCQDTSTNGTWVDDSFLLQRPGPKPTNNRRSLHDSSSITLTFDMDCEMRFFVRIPEREHLAETYGCRLDAYIGFVQQYGRQKQEEFNCISKGIPIMAPPAPILSFDHGLSSSRAKKLIAATEPYHHGMQWNGRPIYEVTGYIGKGAFAGVYKLTRRADGVQFAVKEIMKTGLVKKGMVNQKVESELAIMKSLQHVSFASTR
ncbi:MAG: hypothetical protein Q9219_004865 [cf. Caloplaca sp. 3 TL-2023]